VLPNLAGRGDGVGGGGGGSAGAGCAGHAWGDRGSGRRASVGSPLRTFTTQ
jgi:hypothetical protein